MTEVTSNVPLPSVPLTTVDNLFYISHLFFDQYRTTIFAFTGTVMAAWLYNRYWINRKFYPSTQLMTGKTVLITDGHVGIGYETAKDLLRRGARVVITCSDMYIGRQSVRQLRIESECNEKNIRVMECDLCSFDSVRQFAKLYDSEEERLDVLICNANLMWPKHIVTKDGWNTLMQANYLSHFLLTNLLLNKLKQCQPSRVINVSSNAHQIIRTIDWSDVFTQFKNYRFWGAYSTSKLLQTLSAYKLKRDLGEGINVFAVTPGWVWNSNRLSLIEAFGFYPFLIIYPILRLLKLAFAKTPKTGARTTVFCAVEPLLEKSAILYYNRCQFDLPSWLCTDDECADRLWQLSAEAVQL